MRAMRRLISGAQPAHGPPFNSSDLKGPCRPNFMTTLQRGLLMVLPFALWGTAMAAMAPLVQSGGAPLVARLRLLPAGIAILIAVPWLGRSLAIDPGDRGWFLLFTLVDAVLFQFCLAKGLQGTGAGLGSVLIDSQPLIVPCWPAGCLLSRSTPLAGSVWWWVWPESSARGCWPHCCSTGGFRLISRLCNWQEGTGWMLLAALAMAFGTVQPFRPRRRRSGLGHRLHMVLGESPAASPCPR